MIPTPNQVWLVVEPIDMRAGIDGLSQDSEHARLLTL
jgi:transposase